MYTKEEILKLILQSNYHKDINVENIYSDYIRYTIYTHKDLYGPGEKEEFLILRKNLKEKHKTGQIETVFSAEEIFEMIPDYIHFNNKILNKYEIIPVVYEEFKENTTFTKIINTILFNLRNPEYTKWNWNLKFVK